MTFRNAFSFSSREFKARFQGPVIRFIKHRSNSLLRGDNVTIIEILY